MGSIEPFIKCGHHSHSTRVSGLHQCGDVQVPCPYHEHKTQGSYLGRLCTSKTLLSLLLLISLLVIAYEHIEIGTSPLNGRTVLVVGTKYTTDDVQQPPSLVRDGEQSPLQVIVGTQTPAIRVQILPSIAPQSSQRNSQTGARGQMASPSQVGGQAEVSKQGNTQVSNNLQMSPLDNQPPPGVAAPLLPGYIPAATAQSNLGNQPAISEGNHGVQPVIPLGYQPASGTILPPFQQPQGSLNQQPPNRPVLVTTVRPGRSMRGPQVPLSAYPVQQGAANPLVNLGSPVAGAALVPGYRAPDAGVVPVKPEAWVPTVTVAPNRANIPRSTLRVGVSGYTWSMFYQKKSVKVNPYTYNNIINEPDICYKDTQGNARNPPILLVVVITSPGNDLQRHFVRKTWGKNPTYSRYEVQVVFLTGKSDNLQTNHLLEMESQKYHDIIQDDFADTYLNLTIKSLMGLRWAAKFCPVAQYVMKADDDMIMNLDLAILSGAVYNGPRKGVLMGYRYKLAIVKRTGRWGVTLDQYPFGAYPDYLAGVGYLMSIDVARTLSETAEYVPMFPMEDVYVTGILSLIAGINLQHSVAFPRWMSKPSDKTNWVNGNLIGAHKLDLKDKYRIWQVKYGPLDSIVINV